MPDGRALPQANAVRDRAGRWRHPDIHPAKAWLRFASRACDVPEARLVEHALTARYPALTQDLVAWSRSPFDVGSFPWSQPPTLKICWCSRCLADDYCAGRPAHIRQLWIMAAIGFCHQHHWPLEDRCNACGSPNWRFRAPARGPLRMVCADCWRPLERSFSPYLNADETTRYRWETVIAFEREILTALRGKTPDQFTLNFTSAAQLLREVLDISALLTASRRSAWAPLNAFPCAAMMPGYLLPDYRSANGPYPLATARIPLRRSLLAANCAIIMDAARASDLLNPAASPAIEMLLNHVDRFEIDRCIDISNGWSPTLARRVIETRRAMQRSAKIARMRACISAIDQAFA